jgi:hypothetical protein
VATKAEQYRARAVECEERADETRTREAKEAFAEAARQWLIMAKQAERHGW